MRSASAPTRAEDEWLHSLLHAVREKATVRARVGAEALLIEALRIVQRLLGGVTEDAVGLALECGQVVERRGSLALFLLGYGCNDALAAGRDHSFLSLGPVAEPLALSGKFSEVQLGGIKGFGYDVRAVCLSLRKQGERG